MVKDPLLIGYSFEVRDHGGNQVRQCHVSNPPSTWVTAVVSNNNGNIVRAGGTRLVSDPPSAGVWPATRNENENLVGAGRTHLVSHPCSVGMREALSNNIENIVVVGGAHIVSNPPSAGLREAISDDNENLDGVRGTRLVSNVSSAGVREAISNDSENFIGVGGTRLVSNPSSAVVEAISNENENFVGVGGTHPHLPQPNTLTSLVPDVTEAKTVGKPFVGLEFDTIEASHAFWEKYAHGTGFRARIRSTKKKKDGVIRSRAYVCAKEGIRCEDPRRISDKRRPATRCGCGVIMNVNFVKGKGVYRVATFIGEHNHGLDGKQDTQLMDREGSTSEEGHLNNSTNAQSVCRPIVGMEFDTVEASQFFWEQYAHNVGFGARIGVTRKEKKDGVVRLRTFVCSREGNECYDPRYINSKRRGDMRCGCSAHMTISFVKEKGTYHVEAFFEEHNHGLDGKPSTPRRKVPRQRVNESQQRGTVNSEGVRSVLVEGPLLNLANAQAFGIYHELDGQQNISQLIAHEDEAEAHAIFAPNGSGPAILEGPRHNLLSAQRMGILVSEFTQLAYRAVGNDEVFEGVRRLIKGGHSLADKY